MSEERSQRHPVDELAEDFVGRYRRGEHPSISEYTRRYPELASQIGEMLQALVLMEELGPDGGKRIDAAEGGAGPEPQYRQLGEYRILREVGRGGMGVVYEAEQEALGRHVALKVFSAPPLADRTHVERFRREAQAAARLHHSNIVPVYGVGEQAGVHYYAMQFIRGQGLDQVLVELRQLRDGKLAADSRAASAPLDANRLSMTLAQRLWASGGGVGDQESGNRSQESEIGSQESGVRGQKSDAGHQLDNKPKSSDASSLKSGAEAVTDGPKSGSTQLRSATDSSLTYFQSVARIGMHVAEALACAHAHGVLHRDIKPSNLLLDTEGAVWVTDFGLAKAEGMDELTHTGDIVGTLRYMAPERFSGESDPRSEVYSLGLTLYELLTLRAAFEETDRHRLIQQITQTEPPRPRKLERTVPADLETIVLKASAREPERRYQSATEMAEDLRCFLADRPIQARRASSFERIWRWCRRNPALATATGSALAFFLMGFVLVFWQWRRAEGSLSYATEQREQADTQRERAEINFQRACDAVDQMLTEVGESWLPSTPYAEWVRQALLEKALKFCQTFLDENSTDVEVRHRTAWAYRRAANIHHYQGQPELAERESQRAIALFGALAAEFPEQPRFRMELAGCYLHEGRLREAKNRLKDAEEIYRQALSFQETVIPSASTSTRQRLELASCLRRLGGVLAMQGHLTEAERIFRQSLEETQSWAANFPEVIDYRESFALSARNLGSLLTSRGRFEDAEPLLRDARTRLESLRADHPGNRFYLEQLSKAENQLGFLLFTAGRLDEAEQCFRENIAHASMLAAKFPGAPLHWHELAAAYNDVGRTLRAMNRLKDAEEVYRQSLTLKEKLAADFPTLPHHQEVLALGYHNLASLISDSGSAAHAEQAHLRALGIREKLVAQFPDDTRHRRQLAQTHSAMGVLAKKARRYEQAEKSYGSALTIGEKLVADDPETLDNHSLLASVHYNLATLLRTTGRREEGEKRYRQALTITEKLAAEHPAVPAYRMDAGLAYYSLGNLLRQDGRPDECEKVQRKAVAVFESLAEEFPTTPKYHHQLATTLNNLAGLPRARKDYAETCQLLEKAIRHEREALRAKPDDPGYRGLLAKEYWNLGEARLQQGEHAAAAEAAAALAQATPDDPLAHVNAASLLARCAARSAQDEKVSEMDRQRLAGAYQDRAMENLRAAAGKGFRDRKRLQSDVALESLRSRADFQELVRGLEK
jgi:serine/threonine-protein kinase